jgi:hypothetical protein
VVSAFDLSSLECRAVAGAMMFPLDYSVKRFIVYTKETMEEGAAARLRLEACKAVAATRHLLIRIGA